VLLAQSYSVFPFANGKNCVVSETIFCKANRTKKEISSSSPTKIPLHFHSIMTRDDITGKILAILTEDFEFETPGPDDNLRDDHGFDSIDAIELLGKIELTILGFSSPARKKKRR